MFLFLLLTSLLSAFADVIDLPVNPIDFQQNPSHIEWHKIETEHFQLIFPEDIEDEAQRAAFLLEKAYPFVSESQAAYPPKIPLVLQNQSTQSNGLVTLAPRRSEWYVTPAIDPELSNTEWLKTLSIHEFRHVVQFQKTRKGFNKFLEVVLGEVGQALGIGLTLPPWYLEGDAVGMETALTRGGRGRLPLFERDLRTIVLSGQNYDYDKAHLGSYRDYLPNHYVYGYFYTTFLRNTYGPDFLSRLASYSSDISWNPLAFYVSTDRLTKQRFEKFYADVMQGLIEAWKEKADKLSPTPYQVVNIGKKFGWTNYLYPQVTKSGDVVALKRGLSFIDQFVLLTADGEKTLFYPAPLLNEYPFKVRHDRIAWIEADIDPRWGYRDFGRLKVRSIRKGKTLLDLRKTKLRLAVLNHEGQKILATEWNEKQAQRIVVLDLHGDEMLSQSYPKERVITSLDWISNQEIVMVTKDRNDQKRIVRYDLDTQAEHEVLAAGVTNIGFVAVEEGHILYESPRSGIDNVYVLENGGERQLTSALFGAYAPVLKNGVLLYNDYSASGMNVVRKSLPWEQEQNSSDSFVPFFEKFAHSERYKELETSYSDEAKKLPVDRYSQFKHAVNVHSWLLLAPPLSNSVTVEAFSRDILNKFALGAGVSYNLNERTTQGFVSATWSHLYPVFDLRAIYGGRRQDVTVGTRKIQNKWEEGVVEAGVQIPWKRITGRFLESFTLRAFSRLISVTHKITSDLTSVSNGALYSPGAEFHYNVLSRMAKRDLYPRWGVMADGRMEDGRNVSGPNLRGSIRSLDSRFFAPGAWYHHSFFQQLAFEKQRDNFYQYSSQIFYPRGTRQTFLQEFVKYSANYSMPLFYPDWHWSRYVYVKRIFANLFFDELKGRYATTPYEATTTGWELLSETHFLRIFLPITVGVRGSYVIHGREKKNSYEIFLQQVLGVF